MSFALHPLTGCAGAKNGDGEYEIEISNLHCGPLPTDSMDSFCTLLSYEDESFRLSEVSRLKCVEIHPAREVRAVEADFVIASVLFAGLQDGYLLPERIEDS
jgi:hypothetical protein